MVCNEGKISLWCFMSSASLVGVLFLPNVTYNMVPKLWGAVFWGPLLYFLFINIVIRFVFETHAYQVNHRYFCFVMYLTSLITDCHSSHVSWIRFRIRVVCMVFSCSKYTYIWFIHDCDGYFPL